MRRPAAQCCERQVPAYVTLILRRLFYIDEELRRLFSKPKLATWPKQPGKDRAR